MTVDYIEINGRKIGPGFPVYIVAELSANHHHRFEEAANLVRAAKESGADAVKLQTCTPDTITIRSDRPEFIIGGGTLWDGKTLYDLYSETCSPWEWQPELKSIADSLKIDLFSTPYDNTAVDFLEKMGVPAYKVASFELVDTPLIEYIAGKGKPLIMSTGLATLEEIEDAIKAAGDVQVALLKCTSAYPSSIQEINLRAIPALAEKYGVPVGLSDHSLEAAVPLAAAALGACIIEKHFTLSRKVPGPDSAFSLEPVEFKEMVNSVRVIEQAMGEASHEIGESEKKSRFFRRSLYVVKDMKAGETFTEENVRSIRPSYGLAPKNIKAILGKQSSHAISRGTPLSWELVSNR